MTKNSPLAVVDLTTVGVGAGQVDVVQRSVALAQPVVGLGYARLWAEERHGGELGGYSHLGRMRTP